MAIITDTPETITFVHLKKNGGTSMSRWLIDNCNGRKLGAKHCSYVNLLKKHPKDTLGFCFAIVRNPFARVVSSYCYQQRTFEERIRKYEAGKTQKSSNREAYEMKDSYKQTFDEWLKTNPRILSDIQSERIKDIDCVLKLENLDVDFKIIQDKFRCYEPLKKINVTKHDSYADYYTKETKIIVQNALGSDLEEYGYTF